MKGLKDEITLAELVEQAKAHVAMQQAKAQHDLEMKRHEWYLKAAVWDRPKQMLPDPEFSLDELDFAERIIDGPK